MKKVVLFVRVSTQKQQLDSQIETLKRTALVDGYVDDNIIVIAKKESGVKLQEAEREGLNELKAVIEENDIDCVYIYELSRLTRDPMTLYSIRDKIFKDNKVQLKCMRPSFTLLEEPDRTKLDTMGSLVFSIFGCFAEQEVVEKKERFHRGKGQKAAEGKFAGGVVPYGYEVDRKRGNLIVINQEEASNIRLIFDLYEAGYSTSRVAEELRERGLKYRKFISNTRGLYKDFDIGFIHQILTAELLTGKKLKGLNASFARAYPCIIKEEQFERCRERAKSRNKSFGKARNVFFARSLIVCPECGSRFQAVSAKVHYECKNAFMSSRKRLLSNLGERPKCTNKTCISISALDSLLWYDAVQKECAHLLGSAISDKARYEEQIAGLQEKIAAIQPRLDSVEDKRARIIDSFIDGEITKEAKNRKLGELDEQRLAIFRQKAAFEDKVSYFRSRIKDIMNLYSIRTLDATDIANNIENVMKIREKIEDSATQEEKHRLVHKHIKQLKVEKRNITCNSNSKKTAESDAKFLTITYFDDTTRYYYFLSYDGKGGHWINSDSDGTVLDAVNLNIERKLVNRTKLIQRDKDKARKKADFESKYSSDRKYLHGYGEMSKYLHMGISAVCRRCNEGFFQDALTMYDKKTKILDAERALEIMRASNDAWIRKVVLKFEANHRKED